jgi:hypothetical protein
VTRLLVLLAALRRPRTFSRLALIYVIGMIFLFVCLIGGIPRLPNAPAHPLANPSAKLPQARTLPPGLAEEMRKRMNNRHYGPR